MDHSHRRGRRRRTGRRLATALPPPPSPRRPALAAGQLQALVLGHLRAYPDRDFSPSEIANALHRPGSRGAVINACKRLVTLGLAVRTHHPVQRYQATR